MAYVGGKRKSKNSDKKVKNQIIRNNFRSIVDLSIFTTSMPTSYHHLILQVTEGDLTLSLTTLRIEQ